MRFSKFFAPTLKEDPFEAETLSHRLLLRGGMIRKVAAGVYIFLPLGERILHKLEEIIRQEMDKIGAQEVAMSILQPREIWEKSNRWSEYGPEMMRLKDRQGRDFCLGPTHEEMITDLLANQVTSYRQLPITLYQIQVKFRDEIRPRFGIMRGREFIMKDAYSFHSSQKSLQETYQKMYEAYSRILERCELKYRVVEAESGIIGGDTSHEFMVLSNSGEDKVVICKNCGYAASLEKSSGIIPFKKTREKQKEIKEISTPSQETIEDVSDFLGISPQEMVKTMIYQYNRNLVAVLIRGDRDINEVKLAKALKTADLSLLSSEKFSECISLPKGYLGPVGLKKVKVIADLSLKNMVNFVTGANRPGFHLKNVNTGRDFKVSQWEDLSLVKEGDLCQNCHQNLYLEQGIEMGHIFQLGKKYSQPMQACFTDKDGKRKPYIMGCYGIGVTRLLAAIIEQKSDKFGMVWPIEAAPFQVHILPVDIKVKRIKEVAEKIYRDLSAKNVEVMIDDRDESAGVKFNEADLIGFPVIVICGKKLLDKDEVEVKMRQSNKRIDIPLKSSVEEILKILNNIHHEK